MDVVRSLVKESGVQPDGVGDPSQVRNFPRLGALIGGHYEARSGTARRTGLEGGCVEKLRDVSLWSGPASTGLVEMITDRTVALSSSVLQPALQGFHRTFLNTSFLGANTFAPHAFSDYTRLTFIAMMFLLPHNEYIFSIDCTSRIVSPSSATTLV